MASPLLTGPATTGAQPQKSSSSGALTPNLSRINQRRAPFDDMYHQLLNLRWRWFLLLVLAFYFSANFIFACLYWSVPTGISNANDFWDHFFFSVQTWATIGYGGMTPTSRITNFFVVMESLIGIFTVAMLTGLFFAKFSRTNSRVLFAKKVVINVRTGQPTLSIRVGNERASLIADATARVTMLRDEVTLEGEKMRRMLDLTLVRNTSPFFILSWTIMHVIDEQSPLWGLTSADLEEKKVRLAVNIVGFDSTVGQTSHAVSTYAAEDILFDHRYGDASGPDGKGGFVLDYAKFHNVEPVAPRQT